MTDTRATVIVPQNVAVRLRDLSKRLDRRKALDGMYATGLSASGIAPASHYISSGHVPDAYITAVTDGTRLFNVAKKAFEDDGDVFPYTQAQVNNALAAVVVHYGVHPTTGLPESPRELIARLGLKLITEP